MLVAEKVRTEETQPLGGRRHQVWSSVQSSGIRISSKAKSDGVELSPDSFLFLMESVKFFFLVHGTYA